ncbi:MAG: rhodanese-like domain-containing protein [Deltaproteobacteria bacterium]|nr:rhodanese-like domain-containing protein [Deltaproteobacteria bacterium]MBW2696185.1 rhodanese-like domain-containing protein [Deltaproteobacteria bacterium]
MNRFAITIALGTLLATAAFAEDSPSNEVPSISASLLHEQLESESAPVVIDVRTAGEYASGHIPGAVNIPFDQVAERIAEIDAPHGVALYCMVGPRARKGESALLAVGYEKIFHLEGGLAAWQAAGLPVEETQ